jgi:hypothetical protein
MGTDDVSIERDNLHDVTVHIVATNKGQLERIVLVSIVERGKVSSLVRVRVRSVLVAQAFVCN